MSSSLNRIKKNIIEAMQSANNQGTSAYDSVAEVRRVDGDTAWVHIAGGVDETPVKLTIAAKAGDMVQVRVGGGRAWITGNASAPPTDDHMANTANTTAKTANVTANQALQGANTAQNTADKAQSSADKAQNTAIEAAKTADNYISTDSTGIMVSENNGATKETPSNATKNNVLITEQDVQIRHGQKVVSSYGDATIIGNDEGNSIHIGSSGIDMVAEGQPLAKFGLSNATKYAPVLYDVINKNLTDRKCTGLSTYKLNKNYANEDELKTHVTVKLIYHENDDGALDNNAIVPLDEYHPNSYTLGIAGDHIKITFDENVFQTEVKHFRPSYEGDFSDVDIALTYPVAYGLGMATIGNRLNWPEYNDTGDFSLAIGTGNVADDYSMAIGVLSFAQAYSIACGNLCTAGANSCAFGYSNQAEQGNSFALGSLLHTDAPNQLVIGYKNKTTAEGITARFVVAGGSQDEVNEEEPYNSAAITGDGDVRIKGDLYAHCNDDSGGGLSFTKITSGTGTAKATTGSVSMQPNWWRCGNLVQMEFRVAATGAVNPGKNIATGTITGIPRPVTTTGLRAVSYYGDNANVSFVSQDGAFTTRNCGSDALAKGNDAIGSFTYITDGAML